MMAFVRKAAYRTAACLLICALLGGAGCDRPSAATPPGQAPAEPRGPSVRILKPERKTVLQRIEQPGFNIEAFQETALYARITGYVRKWYVDMGAAVKKDDLLAELHVPEMEVEVKQKEAAVRQAASEIEQARAAVLTAEAQVARNKSQYERLATKGGSLLDREQIDELRLGYEAAKASLEKARADVAAAEAHVEVAKANRDFAQTMLQYAQIRAPYDGVVTQRNVNDRDFVQPMATGARAKPLFVVQQIDPVRVFVNVPGTDASWVKDGDPVSLRLQGAGGELLQGKVTRNARSLDPKSRTLRTEIDLPNKDQKLLPGMYVQATITVQHANVWTIPTSSLATEGDTTFCFRVEGGKAWRTPLQIGLRGQGIVEVLKKQVKGATPSEPARWVELTGDEQIIASDVVSFSDGQTVQPAN
jgi:RND family efflux transporter MFP subunit